MSLSLLLVITVVKQVHPYACTLFVINAHLVDEVNTIGNIHLYACYDNYSTEQFVSILI